MAEKLDGTTWTFISTYFAVKMAEKLDGTPWTSISTHILRSKWPQNWM
jgi:hypothetical protein